MLEAEDALNKLHKTIDSFHRYPGSTNQPQNVSIEYKFMFYTEWFKLIETLDKFFDLFYSFRQNSKFGKKQDLWIVLQITTNMEQ